MISLIRLARLRGTIDRRGPFADRATLDIPAAACRAPLHLLLAGEVTLELPDRTIDLAAGDVVVLPRGQAHRVHMSESPEIDLFSGHYVYCAGAGELLFNRLPDPLHVSFDNRACESIRLLSALMRAEAQQDAPGTQAILSSSAYG